MYAWKMSERNAEDQCSMWDLCEVNTTERPSFTMSMMQFHRNRLAFGSMPVVGSSWTSQRNWQVTAVTDELHDAVCHAIVL